ncbi:unnamed protein product, partial [Arctia plantaginis]
ESPAQLMLGRNLRTKLDAFRPNRENKVIKAQERQQKLGTDVKRSLEIGEEISMRQYRGNEKWSPGQVVDRMGTTDYKVMDLSGREAHRHIDQLRQRSGKLFNLSDKHIRTEFSGSGTFRKIRGDTSVSCWGDTRPSEREGVKSGSSGDCREVAVGVNFWFSSSH